MYSLAEMSFMCFDFRPSSLGWLLSLVDCLARVRKKSPTCSSRERVSLCASKWGFCPFRLVYGHADRCAVSGEYSLRLGKYDALLPLQGIMKSSCHSHAVHNAFQGFCFFSRHAKIRGPRAPQDA